MANRTVRVLVVDDEPIILMLIKDALEDAGYSVLAAAGGGKALELIEDPDHFSVVVTDLNMPAPDGRSVAAQAREHTPGVPVLFVTGRPDLLPQTVEPPPFRLLLKPFRLPELLRLVDEMATGKGIAGCRAAP